MGRLSFHKHEITHKSKKMKLFAALAAAAAAQQAGTPVMPMMPAMPAMPAMGGMNPLMMMSLLGDDSGMDSDLMMLMMMSGQGGMGQMNPLMLSMLLDSDSTRDYDRTKLEQICADAGVDCTAHFADIFQPIETTKIIDCAGATDAAACTTAMEDAYDAIMKNKIRHVRSPPPLNDGRSRYGQHELNAPTSPHEGRRSRRQQDAHDDARWQHGRHEPTLDDGPPRVKTKKSKKIKNDFLNHLFLNVIYFCLFPSNK